MRVGHEALKVSSALLLSDTGQVSCGSLLLRWGLAPSWHRGDPYQMSPCRQWPGPPQGAPQFQPKGDLPSPVKKKSYTIRFVQPDLAPCSSQPQFPYLYSRQTRNLLWEGAPPRDATVPHREGGTGWRRLHWLLWGAGITGPP